MNSKEIQDLAKAIGIAIADVEEKRAQEKALAVQDNKIADVIQQESDSREIEQKRCIHHYTILKIWKSAIYEHEFPSGKVWRICGLCRKIWKET